MDEDSELEQDLDVGDDDEPLEIIGKGDRIVPTKSEELNWQDVDLDQHCKHVMTMLTEGTRRWDDSSGDAHIPVLEASKKTRLTARDPRDKTAPTALHILARNFKRDYSNVPEHICQAVIKFLLEHRHQGSFEVSENEIAQEQPILSVAMTFENDEFIDCAMNCWPDKFSDLLGVQDSEQKNCFHHIFALPALTKSRTRKEIDDARAKTLKRATKLVPMARAATLVAKDKDGNTPVHYAFNYLQCYGRGKTYQNIIKEMVLKGDGIRRPNGAFNNRNESPILYCERTKIQFEEWQHPVQKPASAAHASPDTQVRSRQARDFGGFRPPLGQGDRTDPETESTSASLERMQATVKERTGKYPQPRKANTEKTGAGGEDLVRRLSFSAVRGLSPAPADGQNSPVTSEAKDRAQMPPPPKPPVGVDTQKSKKKQADRPVHELLDFLRQHYIRTRPDLEARDLMEGKDASDTNLYFDATGHKTAEKIIELINRMSVGGFGDTLAYVCIPTVVYSEDSEPSSQPVKKSYPMNQGLSRSKATKTENAKIGRTSLVDVFKRLHEVGVRRILRLIVEDREAPSHTDFSIETALRGTDSFSGSDPSRPILVETWDWRKPDLSTDVLCFAAPTVEHVNLYWSGNQAVLRGWGSPKGIPRLYTNTGCKLKTVTVYASPGVETRDRMDKMLKDFKTDVSDQIQGDTVAIEIAHRMNGIFTKHDLDEESNDAAGGRAEGEKQHTWVKRMEEFRSALNSVHTALKDKGIDAPERVKVALIDDGVDLSNLDTYDGIVEATGLSYYPPDSNLERPWHRSSGGHGTIMANMIVRINPWVSLRVMKLQDGPSNDGGRTIFAESAARAIWGAIRRKVDIISMSWTVKQKIATLTSGGISAGHGSSFAAGDPKPTYEATAIKLLEEAVDAAVEANILMFCSASDDIQSGGMDALPYRRAPKHIFRIGAALALGQRDPHSEDKENIDYFFPGNQVAEAWNPRSARTVQYHDGSSVGTALAAGLASLIIYCAIIMRTYYKGRTAPVNEQGYNRFTEFAEALQSRDKMKRAFDNIDSERWEDKKYLPVWDVFGPATKKISEAPNAEKKMEQLDALVMDLCSKLTR